VTKVLQPRTADLPPRFHSRRPRQLSRPWRNLLLTVHVVVAVGVLGVDLVLLTLGVTGLASHDAALTRAVYLTMGLLADTILLPLAIGALASGVLLGIGTNWGLTRHYWVLSKLVLTIGLATVAVFVLRPALDRAAAQVVATPLAELSAAGIGQLARVAAVAPAAALLVLLTAVAFAIFKPWGRIRLRSARPTQAEAVGEPAPPQRRQHTRRRVAHPDPDTQATD
jgi:hypothetical protein